MKEGVEIFQIESRNPHLHEAGDKEHVNEMSYVAMQVIYHSPVCPERLKREILREMVLRKFLSPKERPPRPHRFPTLASIKAESFLQDIASAPYERLITEGLL